MIEESNLSKALSWVNEADRTEFECCIGNYYLHINGIINNFNLEEFRPTVRVLFYLYISEVDEF